MAQPDCLVCSGTGWRLVDRVDANQKAEASGGAQEPPPRRSRREPTHLGGALRVHRRDRNCTSADRAPGSPTATNTAISKASSRIFIDEPAQRPRLEPQPRAGPAGHVEAFARDYPRRRDTGSLLMGPCGVGQDASRRRRVSGNSCCAGTRDFYDYRELLKEIQASYNPEHPDQRTRRTRAGSERRSLAARRSRRQQAFSWALETIGHILNTRYNESASPCSRPTISTLARRRPPRPPTSPSGQTISAAREETLSPTASACASAPVFTKCAAFGQAKVQATTGWEAS